MEKMSPEQALPEEEVELTQSVELDAEAPKSDVSDDETGENQESKDKVVADEESETRNELTRRQRKELQRNAEMKALMDKVAFLEKLAIGQGGVSNSAPTDAAPKIEDFDGKGIDEYITARDKYFERALVGRVQAEAKATVARERLKAKMESQVTEVKKELLDWDEVMKQAAEDDVQVADDAAAFIAESDIGPKIAYHLAKNPELHEKLNSLSPTRRIAELGKLEDKLTTQKEAEPAKKKVTNAPTKLSNTQGKAALTSLDPAVAARQGYAAWKAADTARKEAKAAAKKR